MKTSSITFAAAALLAATGPALAQSTVTVFGVIDLAAREVKNDSSQSQLASSGLTSSRLGFRGVEDLGGGLKAGFWLEGAIDADTGNATGQNWQRRATVSLMGSFGEIRLGRTKNPTGLNWEQYEAFGDTGMGASSRLQAPVLPADGAYQSYSRSSNGVNYYTPALGGFFAEGTVAAGEGSLGNKYMGARVGYSAGGISIAGAYGTTEVTDSVDADMWNIGASYDLKFVKLNAFYNETEVGAYDQSNLILSFSAPVGDSILLRGSYHDMDGSGERDAQLLAFGAQYNLSRRTALYATYSKISNESGANFTVATGSSLTRGNDSTGYEVGLRHSF